MSEAESKKIDVQSDFQKLLKGLEYMTGEDVTSYSLQKLDEWCCSCGLSSADLQIAVNTLLTHLPTILNPATPQDCVLSLLHTVNSFVAIAGPASIVIGHVFGSLAHVIGQLRVGNTMATAMKSALDQCRMEALEDKAVGIIRQFSQNNTYMTAVSDGRLLDEVTLNTLLAIKDHGVVFLGELYSHIVRRSEQATTAAEAKGVLNLVQLYCHLTLARMMMLHQLSSIVQNHSQLSSQPIRKILEDLNNSCVNEFDFIFLPSVDQVSVAGVYDKDKWPAIDGYLTMLAAKREAVIDLGPHLYTIHCGDYHLGRSLLNSTLPVPQTTKFQDPDLYKIESVDDGYYSIQSSKTSEYFSKVNSFTIPGGRTYFRFNFSKSKDSSSCMKIIRTREGKFMFAYKEFPCRFIYIDFLTTLKLWSGNPGIYGHWEFRLVQEKT